MLLVMRGARNLFACPQDDLSSEGNQEQVESRPMTEIIPPRSIGRGSLRRARVAD